MNAPLVTIIDRPYRRSRAEHVLRELMHTSYPHALLGNLSVAVAQRAEYPQHSLIAWPLNATMQKPNTDS